MTSPGSVWPSSPDDSTLFELSFEHSLIGQAHVAPDGRWLRVNWRLAALLGYRADELTAGMTVYDVTHPDDVDDSESRLAGLTGGSDAYEFEKRYVTKDGRIVPVRVSVALVRDAEGRSLHTLTQVQDRTEELAARDALARAHARFEGLMDHSNDCVCVLDEDGVMQYVSPSIRNVLGFEVDEFVGVPFGGHMHAEDLPLVRERWQELLELGGPRSVSYRCRHLDGSFRWLEAVCSDRRDDPAVQGFVANIRDVTDRVLAEQRAMHRALHDELTGLPNRSLLVQQITAAVDRCADGSHPPFALLFCDLDQFKRINDTFGHDVGDQLLLAVAGRMEHRVRASDTLARLGGDEFVVLVDGLPHRDPDRVVAAIADDLRRTLDAPVVIGGQPLSITMSIGVRMHEAGMDGGELLRDADTAMYRAKAGGRDAVVVYDHAMHAEARLRFAVDAALRRIPDDPSSVVVDYQPIVDLRNRTVCGAEALVRLDDAGNRYAPLDFIGAAEESGMIIPIGHRVLLTAAVDAATRDRGFVTVNMSGRQISDPHLVSRIESTLQVTGLRPEQLVLEVTETSLIESSNEVTARMEDIHRSGVRLALDDFGTGWSSLSYIRRFPVSIVKIDRSFITRITTHDDDLELVRAIIGMAHALDIEVLGEGIETAAQGELLHSLGCDYGQGYLYGKPAPLLPDLGRLRIYPARNGHGRRESDDQDLGSQLSSSPVSSSSVSSSPVSGATA